jgi:hypothetical protein
MRLWRRRRRAWPSDGPTLLELIYYRQEDIMADFSKLQASIDQLATDTAAGTAAIIAALGAPGIDQATVDSMTAAVDAADLEINAAAAAIPTAPAPAPVPVPEPATAERPAYAPNA